ncbi:MAG: DNA-binding protein [Chloroflexia bacterium]|nr:DNA-binding protein [Chloroflexia bacterium]
MKIHGSAVSRIVYVRAETGEDLLVALRQGVAEAGIKSGVFLSGAGSLASYHFHVVRTTNLPPGNTFIEGVGAFDILTVTGAIAAGQVHAHVTFSTPHVAMGGHLEEGCEVLTFALVAIAETPGADLIGWDTFLPRESASQ